MKDSERGSAEQVNLLLQTVATQAETIRLQAEVIHQLMTEGVEEGGPAQATTFLDGTPR